MRSTARAARIGRLSMAVLGIGATVAGCSGDLDFSIGGRSVEDAAVELIEGELTDLIGLGPLEASCPEVSDPEVGVTFSCTATTEDGRTIELAGVVDREDHIDVATTNVVVAESLATLESAGVDLVNQEQGTTIDASAMDCGEEAIVIAVDDTVTCTLTDPDTGDLYDAVYTITDLASGDFNLSWTPRP